jgi:hypothetical protein
MTRLPVPKCTIEKKENLKDYPALSIMTWKVVAIVVVEIRGWQWLVIMKPKLL